MEQEKDRPVKDDTEQLKLEISQLKDELKAKNTQLEQLNKAFRDGSPLLWRGCSRMPCGFVRPHVVSCDSSVYVGGGSTGKVETSRTVYKYSTMDNAWSSLPISPYYTFALAVVKGCVTVIGGVAVITNTVSRSLANFDEKTRKWGHKFPAMPTGRCALSAIANDDYLFVIGGIAENDRTYLDIVEVLDLETMKWATASPVPKPVTFMSIAVCSSTKRIYLLGGLTQEGAVRSVYSCTISELINSIHQQEQQQQQKQKDSLSVWEELTTSPYQRSGCAAINGKLVIASGLSEQDKTTTTIHCFSPDQRKWVELGEMPAARSSCSLAVVDGDQIVVVGGYVNPRNWMGSLTTDLMATVNLKVPL